MTEQGGKHRKVLPGSGRHHKPDKPPLWPIDNPEMRTGEGKHRENPPPRDPGK